MIWNIVGTVAATIIVALAILRIMIVRGGRGVVAERPLNFLKEPETVSNLLILPDGSHQISWKKADSVKLSVSHGVDRNTQTELASLAGELSFTHTTPKANLRHFYTTEHQDGSHTHTAERIWPLPGILNLRDIGGYETADGRVTRWGKIYRTAHLGNATADTLKTLSRYNIGLICDLRSNRELAENPDRVPQNATYLHTPIYESDQLSGIFPKLLFDRASLGNQLGAGYIRMVDERPEAFAAIIGRFADPANLPAMFHCTAGKDRAGLTAAMLLTLLSVPRKTIIADYTLSNLASDAMFTDFMEKSGSSINRFGVPPEQLRPLFVADPSWLENSLRHIDNKYGGVKRYLIEAGGLPADAINALQQNLLT